MSHLYRTVLVRLRASTQRMVKQRALWLFTLVLSLYLLTTSGQLLTTDGIAMYRTTASLVGEGTFSVAPDEHLPQIVQGRGGNYYSKYDPGQPVAGIPFYWAGLIIARLLQRDPATLTMFMVSLLPAVATACAAVVLFKMGALIYDRRRTALLVSLLWATGTLAWPYSKVFFSEALLTLCLLGMSWRLLAMRQARSHFNLLLAGLSLGAAVTVRASSAIYGIGAGAYLVITLLQQSERDLLPAMKKGTGWGLSFAAGALPGVLLVLGHNWLRFHNVIETGYGPHEGFTTPLLRGLYGLLFSPGRSLFLYAPLTLLGLLSIRMVWRRDRALAGFIIVNFMTVLLFFSRWWTWHGGWSWGPRFLVPVVPLLLIPIGYGLQQARWYRAVTLVAYLLSMLVVIPGISVDASAYFVDVTQGDYAREALMWFRPRYSPILGHWRFLLQRRSLIFATHRLPVYGWPRHASWIFLPVVGGGLLVSALQLIRIEAQRKRA